MPRAAICDIVGVELERFAEAARMTEKSTTATNCYTMLQNSALTVAQENAVDALAAGKKDAEVAALVGVNRVTVTRWRLYHPHFIAALNERR